MLINGNKRIVHNGTMGILKLMLDLFDYLGYCQICPECHNARSSGAGTGGAGAHCSETRQNVQKEPKIQRHGFD